MALKKWTAEALGKEARKYKTRTLFARGTPSAYKAAREKGILGAICQHMPEPQRKWTLEDIQNEARRFNSPTEFYRGSSKAYHAAKKRGALKDVCSHMTGGLQQWTDEDIYAEATKYTVRSDFKFGSPGAYQAAHTRGLLDVACSHMEIRRRNWTREEIQIEANRFESRNDFIHGNSAAYQAAQRLGIVDDVCEHMGPGKFSDNDAVYIWKVKGYPWYKIGITSWRYQNLRERLVTWASGLESEWFEIRPVTPGTARDLETQLHEMGTTVDFGRKFDGYTEFRKMSHEQVTDALEILNFCAVDSAQAA